MLLTTTTAAEYLNGEYAPDTIRRWCMDGEFYAEKMGKVWVFKQEDLDAYLRRRAFKNMIEQLRKKGVKQ